MLDQHDRSDQRGHDEFDNQPYHNKLKELLRQRKKKFGKVLLWDCHSVRQVVPTIQKDKFPDLILGDADGASASVNFIESVLGILNQGGYSVSHNHPFKGGYITRYYGSQQRLGMHCSWK